MYFIVENAYSHKQRRNMPEINRIYRERNKRKNLSLIIELINVS